MIKGFLSLIVIYFLATVAAIVGFTAALSALWGIFVAGVKIINWFDRWSRMRATTRSHLTPAA